MKSSKKLLLIFLLVLAAAVLIFVKARQPEAVREGNLIQNGDFSRVSNGMPADWESSMWVTSPGTSFLEAVQIDGKNAVLIENAGLNDARFEQTVAVQENTLYRLSARVRSEGGEGGLGANVSFLGVYGTSRDYLDTNGQWEEVSLYAQTGRGQREATVAVRLGGYGAESTGKAWFTDVSLEAVKEAPIGMTVLSLDTPAPAEEEKAKGEGKDLSGYAIPLLGLGALAYLLVGIALMRSAGAGRQSEKGYLAIVLGGTFLVRLLLAANIKGYGVDIGCFSAWSAKMASQGPAQFYSADYFCDYPPAYMLVLGLLGLAANLLSIPYTGMGIEVLLKLVPIVCDLGLAVLFYHLTVQKRRALALPVCALVALNPAFIVTGSCWGQIDVVTALLMVLYLHEARCGKWHRAIPLFALAVLTKPQAGLLAPLGVAALVREMKDGEMRKRAAVGLALGVGVTLAVALPFSVHQSFPGWLVQKYLSTLESYDYATMSTGNLMFLLGGNWAENTRSWLGAVTYGQVGTALLVLSLASGIVFYVLGRGRERLYLSAALTLQMIYALGPKMHERYIIPGLAVLLLAFLEELDVRLLLCYLVSSACALVNIGTVLAFEYLVAPNLWLGYFLGVVQILVTLGMGFVAVRQCQGKEAMPMPETLHREADREEEADDRSRLYRRALRGESRLMRLTRSDVVFMLALSLVYGAVALYDLGETKAPQTGYVSSQMGERVILDLGEHRSGFHFYYYGGISDTMFTVAASDSASEFSDEETAYFDRGECFKWQALRTPVYDADGQVTGASGDMLPLSGRYIELVFDGAGSSLWEVAAVDENGHAWPISVHSVEGALEGRQAEPETLIDEQGTGPLKPTYQNSMYFDEIYHARTGYEHAHALMTYETTHPPLGKVFMSLCIRAFGMTPFAWRLAGALSGILMLPAMYLLALELLEKRPYARFAALFFALDCMHFTQTRIATIDSFPVLFMMLMFYFMLRFGKRDFWHESLGHMMVDLALSGIFMGMAIASKWIGCYGAVGLAVYFFAQIGRRAKEYAYARRHRSEDADFEQACRCFAGRVQKIICWCVLCFVVVPIVIYCLSYIPYLSAYGPVRPSLRTLKRIWDAQVVMYDYHANLVATHYFASPWYEWPLIMKPMWYYSGAFPEAGKASSIMALGNPAVWWTGLAGILYVLARSIRRNLLPALGLAPVRDDPVDRSLPLIAVGFLSAYLPWVLVSRLTFIYHYFASVPFIILGLSVLLYRVEEEHAWAVWVRRGLLAAALVLFIAFYPLASGHEVSRTWLEHLNFFPGWIWY